MVKTINNSVCRGIAGARASATPSGVVIHNTADNATAEQHMNRLARMTPAQLAAGFAHYFIDETTIVRTEDTYNCAWHTATTNGNTNYVGYEVCRSTGDEAAFLQAEQNTFKQIAEDMLFWGMKPNRNTVRLHKEFSATACPHRSWELHGKTTDAVKDYFINQINKYMTGENSTNSNNDTQNKTENKLEELNMECIIQKGKSQYYYDGTSIKALANPNETLSIGTVYKAINNKNITVVIVTDAQFESLKNLSKRKAL